MNILNQSESDILELKSQWSEDCLRAVSAFANSKGGTLYVGVDDKGQTVKLHNYHKALEDIPNTIRNKLGILPVVTSEKLNNDMVIQIDVAASSVPISFNGKFLSETDIQTTDIVRGNLFNQLEMTLDILRTKYLKSNIHFEGIHRREILEYPYDALREAIINALIHRDYLGTSHIQIRVYDDKLVIMNEGRLPPEVPIEKLKTNHLSVPRNSLLAETFYLAGFIESWGRGTVKIVEKCKEQGLPEPDFTEENGVMTATFYIDRLNENKILAMGLNSRQAKFVLYLQKHGESSIADLSKVSDGISSKTIQRGMDELNKKGIVSLKGEKKGRKYFLSDIYRT